MFYLTFILDGMTWQLSYLNTYFIYIKMFLSWQQQQHLYTIRFFAIQQKMMMTIPFYSLDKLSSRQNEEQTTFQWELEKKIWQENTLQSFLNFANKNDNNNSDLHRKKGFTHDLVFEFVTIEIKTDFFAHLLARN